METLTRDEVVWWVNMLANIRQEKGISYRDLSAKTKIPVSTLHKILHYNKDEVKVWQLMEVGRALGVRCITLNVPPRGKVFQDG